MPVNWAPVPPADNVSDPFYLSIRPKFLVLVYDQISTNCVLITPLSLSQSALPSSGALTARGNATATPTASAMTWPALVPATTTVGDRTARMRACARRANVTKTRANAPATPASGVRSATTTATAASTPSVTPWQAAASAARAGRGGTAPSSVTVTIHRVTSSRDAASAGTGCGARGANGTASASTANAIRPTARVPARQDTVGSSAGSRVPLDSTVKTAGTGGGEENLAESKCTISEKHRKHAVLQMPNVQVPCLMHVTVRFCGLDRK